MTVSECWNFPKYEIESIIDEFVPLKNTENGLERSTYQTKCTRQDRTSRRQCWKYNNTRFLMAKDLTGYFSSVFDLLDLYPCAPCGT